MATMQWASVMDRTAILPCEARPSAPAMHFSLPSSPSSLEKKQCASVMDRTAGAAQ